MSKLEAAGTRVFLLPLTPAYTRGVIGLFRALQYCMALTCVSWPQYPYISFLRDLIKFLI